MVRLTLAATIAAMMGKGRALADGPAPGASRDPRWSRTLSSGATIEVVGVSPHPSGRLSWWTPDGTRLEEAPCDPSQAKLTSDAPVIARAFAVRVTNVPKGVDASWEVRGASGGSREAARRGGKPVPDLTLATALLPAELPVCVVVFQADVGPWQTVESTNGQDGMTISRMDGPSLSFGRAFATRTGTALSVLHDLRNRSVRLLAIDRKGKEHTGQRLTDGGFKGLSQLVVEFDLPPEELRQYLLQERALERVEIEDVALEPSGRP